MTFPFSKLAYFLPRYWTSLCWRDTLHLPTLYSTGVHSLYTVHRVNSCSHISAAFWKRLHPAGPATDNWVSNTLFYLLDFLYWRYVQYSNHTLYHILRHCIALLGKRLMQNLMVLYSRLKFHIIDFVFFYVHIDIFKKFNMIYLDIL
jgi:hypothetical protein